MQLRRDKPHEHGFTVIELLVAMVLSAVVLALIIGVVIEMFGSSERSSMQNKAQKATTLAADMLTSDLRAMRAPQREPRFTGSPDNLRSMILDGDDQGLLVHDLLVAEPSRITFYAELVNSSVDAECVTWHVRPDGALQRDVLRHAPGCTSATGMLQSSIVMPQPERSRAAAAASIPAPFSYRQLRQPTPANPDPSTCTTPTVPSAGTVLGRDQVTAIDMDLRSFVAGRVGRGDQHLQTSVTIASRQGMEYRYAIGCAA